jgi:hypothetical protein
LFFNFLTNSSTSLPYKPRFNVLSPSEYVLYVFAGAEYNEVVGVEEEEEEDDVDGLL